MAYKLYSEDHCTVGESEFPKIKQFAWNHYGESQFICNMLPIFMAIVISTVKINSKKIAFIILIDWRSSS